MKIDSSHETTIKTYRSSNLAARHLAERDRMIELQYIFGELWQFAKDDYYMNKIILKSQCRNYHNIFAK